MIQAGKLTSVITVERLWEVITPTGAVTEDWTAVATIRAERVESKTEEFLAGFGDADKRTLVFRIRWRPGITTNDRIFYDGEVYNLKEVLEIGRRHGLELRLTQ